MTSECQHLRLDPVGGTCLDVCSDCGDLVGEPNTCRIDGCDNDTFSSTGWCGDCFVRISGTPEQIGRYNAEDAWTQRTFVEREISLIVQMIKRFTLTERRVLMERIYTDVG